MGIFNKIRGGGGAGRGDNPHGDQISSAVSNWNPDADRASMSSPAKPTDSGSGRMRFDIAGEHGGGHLMVSPNASGGHDVTRFSHGFKSVEYQTKNAQFSHKDGQAMWHGGSNEGMGGKGNLSGLRSPQSVPPVQ